MELNELTDSKPKAIVDGKELAEIPNDLFIPPDALEILLDSFTGPLDLLLYLIRKQDIDILDIPMLSITQQYLHYIQLMECRRLELAADYLLMAATLAEIKSRLLLPSLPNSEEEDLEDPRMMLVRRLQAYEQIKEAAQLLDGLPRQDREHFLIQLSESGMEEVKAFPQVTLEELIEAMSLLLKREEQMSHHQIARETITVRERMGLILQQLQEHKTLEFKQLFTLEEGRVGLVISLLAILELAKQALVVIIQPEAFSSIHLQAA
jgi:segregation and condensation protein A